MNLTFRPLTVWPRSLSKIRTNSQFSAAYQDTLELLANELDKIKARNVVIQLALTPKDIRRDNFPRSDARPLHPGVLLSFDLPARSVSMPCDTFLDWKDNVRAIALSLEALRKVNRYGVTQTGEQYAGFPALPAATTEATSTPVNNFSTREGAALWLAQVTGVPPSTLNVTSRRATAYKVAARKLHPDAGGSEDEFKKIDAAKRLLETIR